MQDERDVHTAVLVYQAGIANVFAVDGLNMRDHGREATRLLQSDFRTCEAFARGLGAAGVHVASAWCNEAGDIIARPWNALLEDDQFPFSDTASPVWCGVAKDFAFA